MARSKKPEGPSAQPELLVYADEAVAKINDRISKGQQLLTKQVQDAPAVEIYDHEYEAWNSYN